MKINSEEIYHLTEPDGGKFKVKTLDEAYDFCKSIALGHYENFPVGSILIPKRHRKYFYSIYSFSRLADDISDEIPFSEKDLKIELLDKFHNIINSDDHQGNPLFMALSDTMKKKSIPPEPLQKLLIAFKMDSDFIHPESYDDILDYCSYSANPVGELVLRIFDLYNDTTAPLSDSICTGLQLANFWQDISVDINKNRIYLPKNKLAEYQIPLSDIQNQKINDNFGICLKDIYDYTDNFFILGNSLVTYLKYYRLKLEIATTIEGGRRILEKTRKMGTDILYNRPVLEKRDYFMIIIRALNKLL